MLPQWMIERCMQDLQGHRIEGFVQGKGPRDAKIMFVGEAPGAKEVLHNEPFIGQAGQYLTHFLEEIGINREDVYITSAFRSRPYKIKRKVTKSGLEKESRSNRPPTQKEIDAHAPLLDYQIEQIRPQLIVTLGNVALKRLLGNEYRISNVHGKLIKSSVFYLDRPFEKGASTYILTDRVYSVFPMYHPASVIYRRQLLETIKADLANLALICDTMRT